MSRVQFQDTLRGWAVGRGPGDVILVTNDGGKSWRPVHEELPPGGGLSDVQFLDDRTGWAIGPAHILRTDDGGETWRLLVRSTTENGYLSGNAIHFVNRQRGWLVGHSGVVMRSDDGGLTWARVSVPLRAEEHPTLWDVTFVDPSHGWIAGERGTILHTEDGGATWVKQEQGVPIVDIHSRQQAPALRPPAEPVSRAWRTAVQVAAKGPFDDVTQREIVPELEVEPDRLALSTLRFSDARHGWAAGYYADVVESVVLRTDDGGATWRVERIQPGTLLRALFVLDCEHAWAVGNRARTTPQVVLSYSGESP